MRKHGGTPSQRDKHVTLAAISPPGVARDCFVGGQQSGLAGCKPPPLFTREASSCSSQGRRQGEPWGASPRPSAPTYLPGRQPGTAIDVQSVLRLVVLLLTELGRAAADPVVYVRTIGVALPHWQTFNSGLPGLCYGEEFGEVMLSRLGSMKDRHTWAVTPRDVEDLFGQICPARINRHLRLVVCPPTWKPRSDSACTRMLLTTA